MRKRANKVRCPHCKACWDSDVCDGDEDPFGRDGFSRRRKCRSCRRNYYTIELVDDLRAEPRKPGRPAEIL
jgi:transcriptional regulator NrdR family protein